MDKYIPYEKLSKRKQREINSAKRKNWGALNPVTRKTSDAKIYNRKKIRKDVFEEQPSVFLFINLFCYIRSHSGRCMLFEAIKRDFRSPAPAPPSPPEVRRGVNGIL